MRRWPRHHAKSRAALLSCRPVRIALAVTLAALFFSASIRAQERPAAAEPATFIAQLNLDGDRTPLPAVQGTAGPLFLLKEVASRLQANLDETPPENFDVQQIIDSQSDLAPVDSADDNGNDN